MFHREGAKNAKKSKVEYLEFSWGIIFLNTLKPLKKSAYAVFFSKPYE
jgi:hypothetical protein